MVLIPSRITLATGAQMPAVLFGTGTAFFKTGNKATSGGSGLTLGDAVKTAVDLGYQGVDTAEMYDNEEHLGEALAQHDPEHKLWITTKISSKSLGDVRGHLQDSLRKIGRDHVDLYLIHFPWVEDKVTMEEAWRQMEALKESGLTKEIGVSNFQVEHIEKLVKIAKHKPVINQIEYHPQLPQKDLVDICTRNGILIQAYGPQVPLSRQVSKEVLAVVDELAAKYNKTPGQILLKFVNQQEFPVATTSTKAHRLKESLEIGGFTLDTKDFELLASVGAKHEHRAFKLQIETV